VDAAPPVHSDPSRPGVPITRSAARRCGAALAVATLLVACSPSDSGVKTQDLGTASSPSSSSSTPRSNAPTSSVAASSSPASASPDQSTPATTQSPNPWPADLTPEQQDQARAALTALDGYIRVINAASADPAAKDWTADVRTYTADPAADQFLASLASLVAAGVHQANPPTYENPSVVSVVGNKVTIRACIDQTAQSLVDKAGASVLEPVENPRVLWDANVYE
jgi:hypothetical protein